MNEMREVKAEVWLPLTQGKVAVIDFDDFEKVRGHKWHAFKRKNGFYAVRNSKTAGKRRHIFLHDEIIQSEVGVDHIDGDGLNNRRDNLRSATASQNAWGYRSPSKAASSLFRGVSWHSIGKKWRAEICKNGTKIYLGLFVTEDSAARAYDLAAKLHFGEFAQLNFPENKP